MEKKCILILFFEGYFNDIKIKPGTNNVLLAVANVGYKRNGGYWDYAYRFLESVDGGVTWKIKGEIIPSEGWTEDQTSNWRGIYKQCYNPNLAIAKNGNILISDFPRGFLLSRDGGETFEIHSGGGSVCPVKTFFLAKDNTIYASKDGDIAMTKDWGATWWKHWSVFGIYPFMDMKETEDGTLIGSSDGELLIGEYGNMRNIGRPPTPSWCQKSVLVGAFDWVESLHRIIVADLYGDCDNQIKFYYTDDMGETWNPLGSIEQNDFGKIVSTISVDPRNPNNIVAGFYYTSSTTTGYSLLDCVSGGIYYSVDGGYTWNASQMGGGSFLLIGGVNFIYRSEDNPDILVASSFGDYLNGGVWVSFDNGISWEAKNNGLPTFKSDCLYDGNVPQIWGIVSNLCGSTLFFVMPINGEIYRSDDLGENWEKVADLPVKLPEKTLSFLCWIGYEQFATTKATQLCDRSGRLLISTLNEGLLLAKQKN
ncbi:MAG: hypothetical protein ACE14Q_01765 [Acidobacteriota bacterium]